MSTGTQLIRAVLAEHCPTDATALAVIEAALLAESDPLEWCAHRYGLGWPLVLERAAHWAGMAWYPRVPAIAPGSADLHRLDALGEVRFVRSAVFGREVGFLAPRFEHLLHLVAAARTRPDLLGDLCLVPPQAIVSALTEASREALMDDARQRLFRLWPKASASIELTLLARLCFVAAMAAMVLFAMTWPLAGVGFAVMLALVIGPAVLRLIAVIVPTPVPIDAPPLEEAELPVYSVLVPLRDEAAMVPQLVRGLAALDYPPEKLDIKFVVEERSTRTMAAVRAVLEDPRFALVAVPDGPPRTKPKALNYALPLVRGDLLVVYDAEDIPAPDQLRRAAARFAAEPDIDCLQAELVVDNAGEHPLAALFAAEYAGLFGILLPHLAAWGLPMPLGGTSNHFRIGPLRKLGGWDAYNVTEDADLGLRLARFRHRSGVLDSATREEAPITLGAWLAQRTRWMKGWMQTMIVHNRYPVDFIREIGWGGFVFVQVYVGGLILAPLLHSAMSIGVVLRALTGTLPTGGEAALLGLTMAIGYSGAVAVVIAGLIRNGQTSLLAMQVLLPFYWLLHSLATIRAAIDLVRRPFHWHKTAHGRTRVARHRPESCEPPPAPAPVPLQGAEKAERRPAIRP